MDMNIHVSNLSAATTQADLRKAFAVHGDVASVAVLTEERHFGKMTGASKGYGFVIMPDTVRARAAVAALDHHDHQGSTWTVRQARPRRVHGRRPV
jgi:RNA recognition motif-containing protein